MVAQELQDEGIQLGGTSESYVTPAEELLIGTDPYE